MSWVQSVACSPRAAVKVLPSAIAKPFSLASRAANSASSDVSATSRPRAIAHPLQAHQALLAAAKNEPEDFVNAYCRYDQSAGVRNRSSKHISVRPIREILDPARRVDKVGPRNAHRYSSRSGSRSNRRSMPARKPRTSAIRLEGKSSLNTCTSAPSKFSPHLGHSPRRQKFDAVAVAEDLQRLSRTDSQRLAYRYGNGNLETGGHFDLLHGCPHRHKRRVPTRACKYRPSPCPVRFVIDPRRVVDLSPFDPDGATALAWSINTQNGPLIAVAHQRPMEPLADQID